MRPDGLGDQGGNRGKQGTFTTIPGSYKGAARVRGEYAWFRSLSESRTQDVIRLAACIVKGANAKTVRMPEDKPETW